MDSRLADLVNDAAKRSGRVVFLTGAGISAESGIPTFRGEEGFWQIGSRHYHPQELATLASFRRLPHEIWGWYLYRRTLCRAAAPNAAHLALAEAERRIGSRALIVTQNVDGLHLRAGSSPLNTWEIHGNLDYMRCEKDCVVALEKVPEALLNWEKQRILTEEEYRELECRHCGASLRPHVLWFDESYDEEYYSWNSSIRAAQQAALLVVVGTSGATNLPLQMTQIAASRRVPFIVVNADPSPFSDMAERNPNGLFLQGAATKWVPEVAAEVVRAFASP